MKTKLLFSPPLAPDHLLFRLLFLSCLLCNGVFAQSVLPQGKTHAVTAAYSASTGYSGTGANIDIKYHRLEWRFHPDSPSAASPVKYIKGAVTTYFVTTTAAVSTISFDLNKTSFNNAGLSVYYHGSPLSFSFPSSGAVNIITLTLPAALGIGVLDSVTINYAGAPPAVSGQAEGFQKGPASATNNYYYTLSESYEDRDWWPCKADMQDKIDSVDFVISVPSAFWAAAPGVLVDSSVNGSNRTLIFKHRYPIASYLVAVGVAKYVKYYRGTIDVNGKAVPVAYYLFPGKSAGTYTNILNALDVSKLEVAAFSTKFGAYPYADEKHGYYEFGWGGGMEHQSFSAMGSGVLTSWSVIAHELAHQWFGDKVTFATWNHLWLAEGFAKYMESLAAELVPSLGQNPVSLRNSVKTTALATSTTPVYLSNASIANSNTIWTSNNDNAVYQRGAMVVSSLRALVGDAKFFQACQEYLDDPALSYRSATTDDLRAHFEQVLSGFDLSPFFNDWVNGTGNPDYTIYWGTNSTSKRINIQVFSQTRSAGSTVTYFNTPIVLRVQGSVPATMDTTIVVYDNNGTLHFAGNGIGSGVSGNIITTRLSFTPVTVSFDPFNQTMATGTTQQQSYLNIALMQFEANVQRRTAHLELVLNADQQEPVTVYWERSEDGLAFRTLASEQRILQTASTEKFSWTDPLLPGTTCYYRARVEQAGVVRYTSQRMIRDQVMGSMLVYPNPASNRLSIRLAATAPETVYTALLFNNAGSVVRQISFKGPAAELPVDGLQCGIYQLKLYEANQYRTAQTIAVCNQ